MTPSEFKSWFAVFSEAVDGTPTPRQWAKIQKRVDEMDSPSAYSRELFDQIRVVDRQQSAISQSNINGN